MYGVRFPLGGALHDACKLVSFFFSTKKTKPRKKKQEEEQCHPFAGFVCGEGTRKDSVARQLRTTDVRSCWQIFILRMSEDVN